VAFYFPLPDGLLIFPILNIIAAKAKVNCHRRMVGMAANPENRKQKGVCRMKKNEQDPFTEEQDRRVPHCVVAPEWAEHARLDRQDEACNDGREAVACGVRGDDKPCPI
jgi:hypothetical protein